MTTDYRAMCAELLRSLENYPVQPSRDRDLCVRARALLAQPVPEGLSDEEIESEFRAWWNERYGSAYFGAVPLVSVIEWTQHVTARRPTPQPPADGEVGYALLELRSLVMGLGYAGMHVDAQRLERAADLLERQHPQPVAVSVRLPGPEDCDEQGRCWMFGNVEGDWRLISTINPGIPKLKYCFSHWLPANALPTPEALDD